VLFEIPVSSDNAARVTPRATRNRRNRGPTSSRTASNDADLSTPAFHPVVPETATEVATETWPVHPARMSPHAHSAPGHQHTDIDWALMATQLETRGELHLPALRQTATRLHDLPGAHPTVRRILDIGSGPGVMTCVLAETFTDATAIAVDGTPALLTRALARADRLGLTSRITTHRTDLPDGLLPRSDEHSAHHADERSDHGADEHSDQHPAHHADHHPDQGLGTADLIWSSNVVHHLGDQQGALNALAALLNPGGLLAIAEGGLPMRFLPRDIGIGRPGLQARLDAVQEHWFARMRADLPGTTRTAEDWPTMLSRAGLTPTRTFTTLLDRPAPLNDQARAFLNTHLGRLRDTMSESLDADDRATLDVLLDPGTPDGILHRPDAFLLSATTVFTARRPAH
jgi:SAM-dependent methyltransferase